MSAEGGTGYEHREVIQRSKSPWGPFEPSPFNPVVSNMNDPKNPFQAIGHADLVQLPDNSWWLVCLGIRPVNGKYHHLGRETILVPVTWTKDGWPIGGNKGVVKEGYPFPNLPEHIWESDPVRDNFDKKTLNLCWNFIRNPYDDDWSLIEKPGYLRINGSKVRLGDRNSPAFIGRRQKAFNMSASVKINFIPDASNEEAGLVLRGDDFNHYDLLITLHNEKRVVMLRKQLKNKTTETIYHEIFDDEIILRISATEHEYRFWIQQEGDKAVLIGKAPTRDLSTEKIKGFIGTYIGMYASGNGTVCKNPADFDWFDYEENVVEPFTWNTINKD